MGRRLNWLLAELLLLGSFCLAQQTVPTTAPQVVPTGPQKHVGNPGRAPQNPRGKLTNSDVIKMVQAGLSEPTIISAIQSSDPAFDLSPDGLIALHKGGVSQRILDVMMADGSVRPGLANGQTPVGSKANQVELNPQPLPPGGTSGASPRLTLKQVQAFAASAGLKVKSGQRVKNSALASSPMIATLRVQKQAADFEASQLLAAGTTSNAGTPTPGQMPSGAATKTMVTAPRMGALAGGHTEAAPVPTTSHIGSKPANTSVCLNTSIATVNKKTTGVVFTPDPQFNHFTITGCGFGTNPGKIYLQGAFSAHGGKILLYPPQGLTWGTNWTDRFIQAQVDPKVSGELDQNNVSLVVETTNETRAQIDGDSFYALRGEPILLQSVPQSNVNLFPKYSPYYLSPDASSFGNETVTLSVFRAGMSYDDFKHPDSCCGPDDIKLNLKPGFAVDSSQSVYFQNYSTGFAPELQDKAGIVSGTEVQPRWYIFGTGTTYQSPPYYSIYGLRLWVVGPAGISDPWAH